MRHSSTGSLSHRRGGGSLPDAILIDVADGTSSGKRRVDRPNVGILLVVAIGVAVPVLARGTLNALDLSFVALLPVVLAAAWHSGTLRWLWMLGLTWAAVQLLSNFAHSAQPFGIPTFSGPSIAILASGLYWLYSRHAVNPLDLLIAVSVGWILTQLLIGQNQVGNPWKYGLAYPITLGSVALAYRISQNRTLPAVVLATLSMISLVFDSRIQTGLLAACAVAVLLTSGSRSGRRQHRSGVLGWAAIIAIAVYTLYPIAASSGLIGERAQQQQAADERAGANFVLAARLEAPQLLFLATRHPILGIGSYSPIGSSDVQASLEFLQSSITNLTTNEVRYLTQADSTVLGYNEHSQLGSTVLWGGMLVIPFWVLLVRTNIRTTATIARSHGAPAGLVYYIAGLTTWDMLFSPLTTSTHITIAIAFFLAAVTEKQSRFGYHA